MGRKRIRFVRADNKCEFCGAENYKQHPITGSKVVLTVAHLDHNPTNCNDDNLKALCQKCHLSYDAKHHAETRNRAKYNKSGLNLFSDDIKTENKSQEELKKELEYFSKIKLLKTE